MGNEYNQGVKDCSECKDGKYMCEVIAKEIINNLDKWITKD